MHVAKITDYVHQLTNVFYIYTIMYSSKKTDRYRCLVTSVSVLRNQSRVISSGRVHCHVLHTINTKLLEILNGETVQLIQEFCWNSARTSQQSRMQKETGIRSIFQLFQISDPLDSKLLFLVFDEFRDQDNRKHNYFFQPIRQQKQTSSSILRRFSLTSQRPINLSHNNHIIL